MWPPRLRPAVVTLLALLGATTTAAGEPRPAAKSETQPEVVDAEMLRDLELLISPDHARDQEVARRMGFLERLRMLDTPPAPDAANPAPVRAVK